ncbi:MAG: 5-methyltetrahydrofolate--homocysteine methyltransferase [Bacteroidaceae bacterium]|nr:5-methyltetrahydrofolate--homocysteine methyltransferase [Bacteroidaceae bacterium]
MQIGLHCRHYRIREVAPYINWIYFYHAWGFPPKFAAVDIFSHCYSCMTNWIHSFPEEEQAKAKEATNLWKEANHLLLLLDAKYETRGNVRLTECNSITNDILLNIEGEKITLPLLRQQSGNTPFLCLSDFIRPIKQGIPDTIGLFCTTIDAEVETLYPDDEFKHLLVQTLADRLAEATAEKLHEEVRKYIWAYAPDERLTIPQMNNEEFQGIRPAIGYPSLPDISINRVVLPLLDYQKIGISLTGNAMMKPHASVSGLMISHPESHYFSIGKIGEDQLIDYASRRGMTVNELKPFLLSNL